MVKIVLSPILQAKFDLDSILVKSQLNLAKSNYDNTLGNVSPIVLRNLFLFMRMS